MDNNAAREMHQTEMKQVVRIQLCRPMFRALYQMNESHGYNFAKSVYGHLVAFACTGGGSAAAPKRRYPYTARRLTLPCFILSLINI